MYSAHLHCTIVISQEYTKAIGSEEDLHQAI